MEASLTAHQTRSLIYVMLFLATAAWPWVAGVAVFLALMDFMEG